MEYIFPEFRMPRDVYIDLTAELQYELSYHSDYQQPVDFKTVTEK